MAARQILQPFLPQVHGSQYATFKTLSKLYPWHVISIRAALCLRVVVAASIKNIDALFPAPTRDKG
jgi:hypothetical protein